MNINGNEAIYYLELSRHHGLPRVINFSPAVQSFLQVVDVESYIP